MVEAKECGFASDGLPDQATQHILEPNAEPEHSLHVSRRAGAESAYNFDRRCRNRSAAAETAPSSPPILRSALSSRPLANLRDQLLQRRWRHRLHEMKIEPRFLAHA